VSAWVAFAPSGVLVMLDEHRVQRGDAPSFVIAGGDRVTAFALARDGGRIAVGTERGALYIHELATGALVAKLAGHGQFRPLGFLQPARSNLGGVRGALTRSIRLER
jgi:hypothetical protein